MSAAQSRKGSSSALSAKVLKAMGVFGGLQVFTILCSIVRAKLVAVWLGTAGVGLLALYNSTMEMLQTNTQLNLRQSAVRDLSAASASERPVLMRVVKRLALWLGLGGMALVALCSPFVSLFSFGDYGHTAAFAVLSVTMLLAAVSNGEQSILQAFERLGSLAKVSLWAGVTATLISIPLFYFLRLRAVVPVVLVFTLCTFVFSYALRERASTPRLRSREVLRRGGPMLRLGAYLTVSSGASLFGAYLFLVYLNRVASTETVGIYQAGYTLVNTYVGVIFTAISMEYYPRLTSSIATPHRAAVLVRHEIVVLLWVLLPVIALFVAFDDLAVHILYSESFLPLLPYVSIAIVGVLFRAVSWCLAFVILAKGDGRTYVCTEVTSAVITLVLSVAGYHFLGFVGLGAAYVADFALYTVITFFVYRRRYRMRLSRDIWALLLLGVGVAAVSLAAKHFLGWWAVLLVTLPWLIPVAYRRVLRRR